jgi:short-subunit dehydrogenase
VLRRRRRLELDGAAALVVGASSGIGRATAVLFAQEGCRLVLAARSGSALAAVRRQCLESGAPDVVTCAVDVGEASEVDRLARVATEAFDGLDVWVNTASVLDTGDLTDSTPAEVTRAVATNVTGTLLLSRAALAHFDERGRGTLINVSSLVGVVPNPALPVYSASKSAALGLTLALQRSPRPKHVRVCLVLPGPVDTPIYAHGANHAGRALRAIPPAASPWRMAARIVACARRPRRVVALASGRALLAAHRVAPRATEWALTRYVGVGVLTRRDADATSGNLFAPAPATRVSGEFRRGRWRRRLGGAPREERLRV